MISAVRSRSALRAGLVASYILLVEWTRVLLAQDSHFTVAALLLGGAALAVVALGWPANGLGLGKSHLALRVIGGTELPPVKESFAAFERGFRSVRKDGRVLSAFVGNWVDVSTGKELALAQTRFSAGVTSNLGALYAALDELGGAPVAVAGSTLIWTVAHALSHPPEFLGAVAAAGLLLALWRWACKDLVAPIVGHVVADLAL